MSAYKKIIDAASETYLGGAMLGTKRAKRILDIEFYRKNIRKLREAKGGFDHVERWMLDEMEKFSAIRAFERKSGIKMGALVSLDWYGNHIVGFVEELHTSINGKIVTNIERDRFSGQNSLENYIVREVCVDELTLIATRPDLESVQDLKREKEK